MVSTSRIRDGLVRYVDNEVLPHMTGVRKVAMGTYVALAADRLDGEMQKYIHHPAIEMLGIANDDGVDVDKLMTTLADRFNEKQTLTIPLMGDFTFERRDIEKLREYIGG